jgi:hypothetical protein
MNDSFVAARVKHSDLHQLSMDGASNAIGSLAEYEVLSRASCLNDVDFNVCLAHQNERSGGYASGTIKFAEPANDELGDVLIKNHQIQVRLNRSAHRMKVYRSVQERNVRKPKLSPDPAGETRWNGVIDETVRANMIMGDMCETIMELLDVGGEDCGLLTANEVSLEDYSRLSYTDEEKMILCQFEGAATAAMVFSKFTQDGQDVWSYVLFSARLAIHQSKTDTFTIVQGKYSSDLTISLLK